jgi:hypothetical protein
MVPMWLKQLARNTFVRPATARTVARRPRPVQLRVEALETRDLPSGGLLPGHYLAPGAALRGAARGHHSRVPGHVHSTRHSHSPGGRGYLISSPPLGPSGPSGSVVTPSATTPGRSPQAGSSGSTTQATPTPGPLPNSVTLSDASGHLFRLGIDHELYYSASGLGNDWQAVSGPYLAIAGDAQHDVFALGIDHKLYRCTASSATPTGMTGVQTLLQSYHGNGAQVLTVLDNGALQQSDDGINFSTIGLGGGLTQIAAGQDSAGRQVLFALRQDGVLFVDSAAGVTHLPSGVQSLVQSYNGTGVPTATLLSGGQLVQSQDGVNFSTIGLGGPLTQIAEGRNASGQQLIYALRGDGALLEDGLTGVTPLEKGGVQTLIQTRNSVGVPCIVFLQSGQFQQSTDGIPADVSTIDLGGTVLQMAEGRTASGQQVLYALRGDGVLLEDTVTGVRPFEAGVQTLLQTHTGAGVPCIVFLQNNQVQDSTDGIPADVTLLGLGGPILQLTEGRLSSGQQVLYALRGDGTLFEDAPWGVSVFATGVQTVLPTRNGTAVPCIVYLQNGHVRDSTDGNPADASTVDLGGPIVQIAGGGPWLGQALFFLRNDGVLFEDITSGVTAIATFPNQDVSNYPGWRYSASLVLQFPTASTGNILSLNGNQAVSAKSMAAALSQGRQAVSSYEQSLVWAGFAFGVVSSSDSAINYSPAAAIVVSGVPSTMAVGQVANITVTVEDANGNPTVSAVTIGNAFGSYVSVPPGILPTNNAGQVTFPLQAIHSWSPTGTRVSLTLTAGKVSSSIGTTVYPSQYNWAIQCLVEWTNPDDNTDHESLYTNPSDWPYYTTTAATQDARAVATGTITGEVWDQFINLYGYNPDSVTVYHVSDMAAN